ncbi:polynucleotide kinase 3 phosphatase-domain-containing protein [Apiosordaria backusii]|uniref:Polynucleotide kinase 3 phosphatase-domain-containing protein n=1 Tax=Apiosordaria backusii TaxID=314023 RepID=A0AA39ZY38_9PEZI|nr:polynucleotide kinase 3 phosphatase-domain-containing protein [Apiosordaria backusii]
MRRIFGRRLCAPVSSLWLSRTYRVDYSLTSASVSTMSPPKSTSKRPAPDNRSISPPPLKRKAQTAISKSAVANFFTPASQKPKEPTVWSERSPDDKPPATLLVAKYPSTTTDEKSDTKRRKIAAFDLDSTLIATSSGKKHADDPADWKWWHNSVPARVRQLYHDDGYQVVIFTNQGGLTLHPDPKAKAPTKLTKNRVANFKTKCNAVLGQLGIPITLYAATGKDIFRKPRSGMWEELKKDYNLPEEEIDRENSIFVGDAGGRTAELKGQAKDFSCSDRNLASNIGIKYLTPEEYFLGEQPRDFKREFDLDHFPLLEEAETAGSPKFAKKHEKEVVLFVGPPGAGKSTFFWKELKPLGYERVNQDLLKSKDKCLKAAAEWLKEGESVVIDNTNADPDTRAQWIDLAKKHKVPIRCVWFKTPLHLCEHNSAVRALNKSLNPEDRQLLPQLAFNGFKSRFKEPKDKEGFDEIVDLEFKFKGSKEEYAIWGKYWV